MAKMFNEEMAKFYEKYYENKGVTLIKGDTATGFEGDGKVESMLAVSTELICIACLPINISIGLMLVTVLPIYNVHMQLCQHSWHSNV